MILTFHDKDLETEFIKFYKEGQLYSCDILATIVDISLTAVVLCKGFAEQPFGSFHLALACMHLYIAKFHKKWYFKVNY